MTERGQRNEQPHDSVSFAVLPVEAVYMELESLCRPDVTPSLGPAACPAWPRLQPPRVLAPHG